jgi:ubiquinol-cytochrome c reductase cytochrome b subunit
MPWLESVGKWLDQRLQLSGVIREATTLHRVPRSSASWFYVFGSAALTVFILQVVTGILLALLYVPSAAEAWNSLQTLNHTVTLGWFVRALHGWGSNFMVALVLIHMIQVFLFGAYKYPREFTWVLGVFLLLMTLGMAFTGQVLRFDQDAYWGLGIGASIMSRVPLIGGWLVNLLLGGAIIGGNTLSRFFALHVFVIPGTLIALVGLHVLMVFKLGINEWPMPGRLVRRSTYLKEYEELTHKDGVPFVPDAFWKDLIFAGCILLAVALCAIVLGPFGPSGQPDPTIIQTVPQPDFFFLWLYALLSLLPPQLETPFLLIAPVVGIIVLLLLPFLSGEGEKSWRRRPVAVLTVLLAAVTLGTFTKLASYTPWSPKMNAWSGLPVPVQYLKKSSPLERQGALVFQEKQCRNCHMLGGTGGERGPALDAVAVRLTQDQLIRQVLQGRGNMPAYGKNLSPAETTALVAFLTTLHPAGQRPARDASLASEFADHNP